MATKNDSHVTGGKAPPKHTEPVKPPVPMRHRNRLGATDLQSNPYGTGRPSTVSTIKNGGRGW